MNCLMKKIFFLTSIVSFLFSSCTKERGPVIEVKERVSLEASIEDVTTKTDYTISDSKAIFKWRGTEVFGRLIRATEDGTTFSQYASIDYTSTSELDAATGVFSGEDIGSGYADTELAVYPVNKTNGANLIFPTSGNNFTLTLNESLSYDASNPLKDIVPMVGKLDGTSYTFKPLTGVLAVNVKNIPSTATKITISSTGQGLSGTTGKITGITDTGYKTSLHTQLYDAAAGLPLSWFHSAATKSYTFSRLNPANTYTFYFPIPTGTLPGLVVTFYSGNTVLYTVKTNANITITRGHITPLKLITMPQYKVTVGGSGTAPNATFYRENATIFFTVSASADELAKASYIGGMKFTHDPSNLNHPNTVTYEFVSDGTPRAGLTATSGRKYLHYIVAPVTFQSNACKDVPDGEIIARGCIPFYYLSSSDKTKVDNEFTIQGEWTAQLIDTSTDGDYHPGSSNLNACKRHFTLKPSNDITKGNIMLYEFIGRSFEKAGTDLYIYLYQNSDGTPLYGTLTGNSITISSDIVHPFWPTSNDNYFIGGYASQKDVNTSGEDLQDLIATLSEDESDYIITFSTPYIHLMYFRNSKLNTFACLHNVVGKHAK